MMENKTLRIAVFDDSPDIRTGLSLLIGTAPNLKLVGCFSSANDCLENVQYSKPDVILMDIEMPGISGIDAVKLIKAKYPDINIVMQTVFEDDERVFQSICAGASGYLLKGNISDRLFASLEELRMGGAPMSPSIALKVLKKMKDLDNQNPITATTDYHLSNREREVLSLIMKGLNHHKISEELFISYETVRSHVKKIYEKLHVVSKVEAINKARNERII